MPTAEKVISHHGLVPPRVCMALPPRHRAGPWKNEPPIFTFAVRPFKILRPLDKTRAIRSRNTNGAIPPLPTTFASTHYPYILQPTA